MRKLFVVILCFIILFCSTIFYGCKTELPDGDGDLIETPDNSLPPETPETPEMPETPEPPIVPPTPQPPTQPEIPQPPTKPEVPAPAPLPKGDVLVMSKQQGLNVRSGKGTSYASVGSLDYGDMVDYVALDSGWYEIKYKNKRAYVSANLALTKLVGFTKASVTIEKVVEEGKKLLGLPYVYGAERYHWGDGVLNPKYNGKSYDCSSLTQYIFKKGANVNIATTSREQCSQGKSVSKSKIARGDLLIFTNDSRAHLSGTERIGHVALYLGDNYILHTASDHAVIEPISSKRWSYYITARRLV